MRVEILHPEVAGRDCNFCLLYVFNEQSGYMERATNGDPITRTEANPPRCETPQGCYKGTPENQRDFSPKNREAWRHFLGCRALGRFPADSMVEQNAEIIANALFAAEQDQRWIAEQRTEIASARMQAAVLQAAAISSRGAGP